MLCIFQINKEMIWILNVTILISFTFLISIIYLCVSVHSLSGPSASHFSLPALSVDPGAEAGGGRCPEAWQSCGRTQYSEFFGNCTQEVFLLNASYLYC